MANERIGERIVIGRIRSAYGVKGWLKVQSFTSPEDNLFTHSRWGLSRSAEQAPHIELDVADYKASGKDLLVLLQGLEDRDQALKHGQAFVSVPLESMPSLADDEVYWHQLEGMEVFSVRRAQSVDALGESTSFEGAESIGHVAHMLETGATDVLVIDPRNSAISSEESSEESSEKSTAAGAEDRTENRTENTEQPKAVGRLKSRNAKVRKGQNGKQPQQLMVPYVVGHSILQVDIEARRILIDWQFD